eukprot:CAMPEP_0172426070 /NCGR_PEP_ID=MMETSP1064-20121228/35634_1 /TAXON_ID=202472 /ORGANISM="Aulacoseira subarctica , Strain CCAP 1002/5" /LENGTH=88 /DNA_ID=CAMNT_0013169441 /DNA_START=85 /DNA_END=351 /DNA_ORIENTATION=+
MMGVLAIKPGHAHVRGTRGGDKVVIELSAVIDELEAYNLRELSMSMPTARSPKPSSKPSTSKKPSVKPSIAPSSKPSKKPILKPSIGN